MNELNYKEEDKQLIENSGRYKYYDFTESIIKDKDKIKEMIEKLKKNLSHYDKYCELNLLEKINVNLIDAEIEVLREALGE